MKLFFQLLLVCTSAAWMIQCSSVKKAGTGTSKNLVWSDEFNTPGMLDTTKWSYDLGNGCPNLCGWGNNELEYYTVNRQENARIENGSLVIEARREPWKGAKYTSARVVTKQKGDWKYGRMEARLKCPVGRGSWAAFWMLPTDKKYGNWPHSGEIDIMEFVGYMPDSVFGTVHTNAFNGMKGTQKSKGMYLKDLSTAFHVYAIEWHADRIDYFLDGALHFSFKNVDKSYNEWPFDQPFYLIFNMAVGGNWGGSKGVDQTIWPQRMEVDYVRVYKL